MPATTVIGNRGKRSARPASAMPSPAALAATVSARVASTTPSPGRLAASVCWSGRRRFSAFSAFSTVRHRSRSEVSGRSDSTTTRDNGWFRLADVTPGWERTSSSTVRPSSGWPSRPRTSIQARVSPRQQCRPSVSRDSSPDTALARAPATAAAVVIDALVSAVVACRPATIARDGNDRRMDVAIFNGRQRSRSVGAAQRGGAGPSASGLLGRGLGRGFLRRGLRRRRLFLGG